MDKHYNRNSFEILRQSLQINEDFAYDWYIAHARSCYDAMTVSGYIDSNGKQVASERSAATFMLQHFKIDITTNKHFER